ncbi:ABC transporter substrate-binding protein [Pseudonocardia acaciae]|uniref:ABC transporter substrate-binding protein n=1 Tax=Pseudonocardia acaciae TaxID=551276 RepID=UPI0004922115|nr:ABC transporter substrate-binding protein [Pseudonocardia acaciae]
MTAALGLIAVLALLGACGGKAARADRPTIRYGIATQGFTSMDPLKALQPLDRMLSMMLFDGLVRYRTGDTTAPFEPGIAEQVPQPMMRDGRQVWMISLRAGVMCPAGRKTPAYELTSEDVVYSLQRAGDPARSTFATAYTNYGAVTAAGPRTVEVTMKHPVSPAVFLASIANTEGGLVVCRKAVEAEGDREFGQHPVGTGPFTFKSHTPGQQVEVVANDAYYRGRPRAAGWTIRFINDDTARQAALFSGDLDLADPPDTGDRGLEAIDQRAELKTVTAPLFGTWYAMFNTTVKPLDDVRVRRALAYAIDRADFVASAGARTAKPTLSAWGDRLPGGVPDEHTERAGLAYQPDLDRARRMLAEAGYANGFDVTITGPGVRYYEILQAQLAKVGVRVHVKTVDTPTWQKAMLSGREPIIVTLIAYRPTPQIPYATFFYGPSAVLGGSRPAQNYNGYTGADPLIQQADQEADPVRQQALWEQINDRVLSDAVVKPLMVAYRSYGAVCGFTWGGVEPPVAIPANWQAGYDATVDPNATRC